MQTSCHFAHDFQVDLISMILDNKFEEEKTLFSLFFFTRNIPGFQIACRFIPHVPLLKVTIENGFALVYALWFVLAVHA